MKICIFGAGAIGGYLAAKLCSTAAQVSLVARGPHLAALQQNGLTLIEAGESTTVPVTAVADARELGPQDYVIVTLKAHSVAAATPAMQPLIGAGTAFVMATNGVPWWYFYALDGPYRDSRIRCLDPDDVQWRSIGPERVIGCVVYPACEVVEPGVIRHIEGNRLTLGEPDGNRSERVSRLSEALIEAGLRAPVRRIRDEIWLKLWGNMSFNPISALTHATLDVIASETPGTRDVARQMMVEAEQIGTALGVRFAVDVDKRIDGAAAVGAHRTSMLQDLEQGRPMEIDALLTAIQEMGRLTGIATPIVDIILALTQQRARAAGLY